MYKSDDPATLEVRRSLTGAMLKLLERVPYDDISVTRLCEAADVVKRRYFQIFQSKEEVLDCCVDDLVDDYAARHGLVVVRSMSDIFRLLFDFFKEFRHDMRLFVRNGKTFVVKRRCRAFLLDASRVSMEIDALTSGQDAADLATYVVGGAADLLEECLLADQFSDERADEYVALAERVCA